MKPTLLVQNQDSEHLETHLVAVPNANVKEFMRSYETLVPMVVPRSAQFVAQDDEFNLYAVTTFKKHSSEFVHKARERKWVPRDYKFKEGGKEDEKREFEKTEADEKRVWGETLRLGRTGWSEVVMCLVHVVVLRVFVETVLRYGLPLDYVGVLVKVCSRHSSLSFLYWSYSDRRNIRRLTWAADRLETREEGSQGPRRYLRVSGRQCLWTG